jgi:hypothetical protein
VANQGTATFGRVVPGNDSQAGKYCEALGWSTSMVDTGTTQFVRASVAGRAYQKGKVSTSDAAGFVLQLCGGEVVGCGFLKLLCRAQKIDTEQSPLRNKTPLSNKEHSLQKGES